MKALFLRPERTRKFRLISSCLSLLLVILTSCTAFTQTETIIHRFAGPPTDGANPGGRLVADASRNLYGTTFTGGSSLTVAGTVFRIGPSGYSVLCSLSSDAGGPNGDLLVDESGNLYGTTFGGGAFAAGTVFRLSPPSSPDGVWIKTILYDFTDTSDGGGPQAGVIADQSGNLYGTTGTGGAEQNGVVFELSPPPSGIGPWIETVLHSFSGIDGSQPLAPLVFDNAGNLYGTTNLGGSFSGGTVFELSRSGGLWTETVLHNFGSHVDGLNPHSGLLIAPNGALVGTTAAGGTFYGTVYALSFSGGTWQEHVLYRFKGRVLGDGEAPYAPVVLRGRDYFGTTHSGGTNGWGTIFRLSPPAQPGLPWTESVVYQFLGGTDGSQPDFGVIVGTGNALYGATSKGGGASSFGTIFRFFP